MSSADFWIRPDRFSTLARLALMDRVKLGHGDGRCAADAACRGSRRSRPYSAELSGRLALQLHLIKEGIKDAIDDAPIELALAVEPVFDGAGDRQATLQWCRKLTSMYRAWADKRRMHISDVAGRSKDKETPILLISRLRRAPRAGAGSRPSRLRAIRRFGKPGDGAGAPRGGAARRRARRQGARAGDRGLDEAPRPNNVVRRYREEPPLVRDAAGQWRTGRLDLVLGGDVRSAAGRPALTLANPA